MVLGGWRMKTLLLGLLAALLAGCAAFEQTPDDLSKKVTQPTKGHLYERDPVTGN